MRWLLVVDGRRSAGENRALIMIRLENVTKEYDLPTGQAGQLVAADRLTLEVPACEVFGLVGPNGAGKTTTLKMICGLMLPTAGRITVNNIDVERQPEEVQQYIGYLADFFSVYDDLKTWEYVEHFARAYKLEPSKIPARVREVIGVLGLETKYDAFVGGLSRGMKQRLGIARAIVLRVGKIGDVMRGAGMTKRVRIRLAAAGFALGSWLAARTGVSEVKEDGLEAEFVFPGTETELSGLVRDAVIAGASICGVEEKVETLEALFSRLSSGEVM